MAAGFIYRVFLELRDEPDIEGIRKQG